MDALALKRIEIDRERRDQRLAFAGLHLGDFAAVERDAADQLDVVMALAERADGRLADRRERFGKQVVELLATRQPLRGTRSVWPRSSSSVSARNVRLEAR